VRQVEKNLPLILKYQIRPPLIEILNLLNPQKLWKTQAKEKKLAVPCPLTIFGSKFAFL
jgi:hypothetical protein